MTTQPAYARQLRQLLPPGVAWDFPQDGVFAGLLAGLAEELARVDARALDLLEEMDPRTALELLADWERITGLPDNCDGAVPDSIAERQTAVHEKLTKIGSQSIATYKDMAARLGYLVDIEEHRPARMGMHMGDRLNGEQWTFAWTVRVRPFDGYLAESSFIAQFRMGDRMGMRLRGWGALNVECVIGRAKPAHTVVLFAYDVEPDAAFWIDFTS